MIAPDRPKIRYRETQFREMLKTAAVVFAQTLLKLHEAASASEARAAARHGRRQLRALNTGGKDRSDVRALLRVLAEHTQSRARHLRSITFKPTSSPDFDFSPLHAIGLTRRECEVLGWVAHGKRDAEIAAILGISRKTVGKHLEHLLSKLHVETRTAAVSTAHERKRWLIGRSRR